MSKSGLIKAIDLFAGPGAWGGFLALFVAVRRINRSKLSYPLRRTRLPIRP